MFDAERFLNHLRQITGRSESSIRQVRSDDPSLPDIAVFVYEHWPVEGYLTAFTFGLSLVSHPEWKSGRPELMISMESLDPAWPFAAGYLASKLRGKCPFLYGETINFGEKISESSDLDVFLVFAPPHLRREDKLIEFEDYRCNIAGLYPMYSSELDLYAEIGLEKFWHLPGWDPFVEIRPRLA
jgi:hypothetical protein